MTMPFRFRHLLGLLLVGTLSAAAPLGGWITYWALDSGLQSVRSSGGEVEDVFLFALQWDAAGNPVSARPDLDRAWGKAVTELRSHKGRVWLTVVNDRPDGEGRMVLKDAGLMHEVLADRARRRKHIGDLVSQCQRFGADGLDVDYENLDPIDREAFSGFVEELARALHRKRLALSVTVQPKIRESRSKGPGAADWAALGKAADRLQIMLYNLHNTRTEPGPVCTSSWMDQVLAFAATQCDRGRIVPVLKVSGFDWGPRPREVTFGDLAPQFSGAEPMRHPDGQAPYVVFDVEGKRHTAFVEDATSLRDKAASLRRQGFSRVVLWSLGAEDPGLWRMGQTSK